jgi:hypothetical protein
MKARGAQWKLLLLVGVLSTLGQRISVADNFGTVGPYGDPPSGIWLQNGPHMHVNLFNLSDNFKQELKWALNNNYDPTDLNTFVVDSEPWDTQARDGDYGPFYPLAWTNCPPEAETGGQHPTKWCHGSVMRFNLDDPTTFDTLKERRSRTCHELGRPAGLDYSGSTNSCMYIYFANRSEFLLPHDQNHLNQAY